jgi:hypothetical protein
MPRLLLVLLLQQASQGKRCVSRPHLLLLRRPWERSLGRVRWSGCCCRQSAPAWLPLGPWTFCPLLPPLLLLLLLQGRRWCLVAMLRHCRAQRQLLLVSTVWGLPHGTLHRCQCHLSLLVQGEWGWLHGTLLHCHCHHLRQLLLQGEWGLPHGTLHRYQSHLSLLLQTGWGWLRVTLLHCRSRHQVLLLRLPGGWGWVHGRLPRCRSRQQLLLRLPGGWGWVHGRLPHCRPPWPLHRLTLLGRSRCWGMRTLLLGCRGPLGCQGRAPPGLLPPPQGPVVPLAAPQPLQTRNNRRSTHRVNHSWVRCRGGKHMDHWAWGPCVCARCCCLLLLLLLCI